MSAFSIRNLLLFFSLAGFTASALAQTDAVEKKEADIMLRVICSQPVEGVTDLKLVQNEVPLQDVKVVSSLLTDPIKVGRGELSLAKYSGSGKDAVIDPIVKFSIPAAGSRFVLAMFPSGEDPPKAPYQHLLIRTDGLVFKASDLYLFNLTKAPIAGGLGKSTFVLPPGQSKVVTPDPEREDKGMYQARFYHQLDGDTHLFNDTRWPVSSTARVYLFFIPDPVRDSFGYVSFREYAPFP